MCILAHSARPASSNQASPVFRAVAVLPEARFSPRFGLRALRWSSAVLLLSSDSQSTYSGADVGPPRIAPRYLFDLAIGNDNLFHGDKYKVSGQITVINLTNKYALYNFQRHALRYTARHHGSAGVPFLTQTSSTKGGGQQPFLGMTKVSCKSMYRTNTCAESRRSVDTIA